MQQINRLLNNFKYKMAPVTEPFYIIFLASDISNYPGDC
ncbi:hypothetical protein BH11BAC3_BH11BAC3_42740 [soil metagenome]